jgi:hypothetical protein
VRAALDHATEVLDHVEAALAQLALSMAEVAEAGGAPAVSASRELRAILDDLAGRLDDDTAAYFASIAVPGPRGA